jgi:hypothetical protein
VIRELTPRGSPLLYPFFFNHLRVSHFASLFF